MKQSVILALLARAGIAAAAAQLDRRGCGNNCANAVAATRFGPASYNARLFDCSSYLRVTVTPSPSCVPSFSHPYISLPWPCSSRSNVYFLGRTEAPTAAKRDEPIVRRATSTDKAVPAYASPCSGTAAYISACSCAGVKASTVTDEPWAVTATITVTDSVTLQGDSLPLTSASGPVETPDSPDWTSTYEFYEVTLPTFDTMTTPITFAPAVPTPTCLVDPSDPSAEFYLLDQKIGYLFNRNGKPGPPIAPTTQAEADAMTDMSKFNPPVYRFEKPASSPAGLYDLVMVNGTTKQYIALKGTAGEVVFASSSTNGKVVGRLITTLFSATCKGFLTAQQGTTTYVWKGTADGTLMTAGTSANDTIVLLPKAGFSMPGAKAVSRRGKAEQGDAPRCKNAPQDVIAVLRKGARGNNPNGCGPANGVDVVPDWNFGRCCDAHDNCYDDCGAAFEECNNSFHDCMHGKCWDVLNGWTWWLFPACWGMADFYAFQRGQRGARCECVCPSTDPDGYKVSLCEVSRDVASCVVTGAFDNHNCGGCGFTCPYKTHCDWGTCQCDQDRCGNMCLSLLSHPRNCGRCGNVCASGFCYKGSCWDPPAVPDQCYAVDAFTNGDFATRDISPRTYTSPWGGVGPTYSDTINFAGLGQGINLQYPLLAYDWWNVVGTITLSQVVRVCPGTSYELDFWAFRFGTGLCKVNVKLGNRVLAQNADLVGNAIGETNKATFGPYPVPAFNEGDAGTTKDGYYLNVKFTVEVSCSPSSVTLYDFSLHT
ncbi:hypothetical protein QBC46DRAFT_462771 [Diplogelasinospora grovesii]|uniref:Uncharacterized protein n=1 Tax=Diplogelasinospora grovesii TaxID=303347 RepID=A0AAN6MWJ2_9PEZI|nr:hypothetical protein QBC46DRAFT_462771 [Diplogelasinospora grovesii]